MLRSTVATALALTIAVWPATAQRASTSIVAMDSGTIRVWDRYVDSATRSGELRLKAAVRDPSIPEREIERFEQRHLGVPVWGADVVRDIESGFTRSVFGELAADLPSDPEPRLSPSQAASVFAGVAKGGEIVGQLDLVIAPDANGARHLSYTAVTASLDGIERVFIDANSGVEILRYSELETQSAVATGRGVLGDTKKLSVEGAGGSFFTSDLLRPPSLVTYDMRGNLARTVAVLDGRAPLLASDRAAASSTVFSDPAVVDAHVHAGWTYDYFFKRFGRRGLDDRDRSITILTNAVSQQGALSLPITQLDWALNAFWCDVCGPGGTGSIFFGNGIPPGFTFRGKNYTNFAGALDIVAHELTHGVTSSTSRLIYLNESGALNEAFSDIMGTSVEFFFQPPGTGPGRADYLLGEDISRAAAPGTRDGDRSLADPSLFGNPDHYSRRYTGSADNGGVHTNSSIANHAFYLAIEGGTNRTSGLTVQGVGAANREQIEKVFYRAFAFLMPASGTFSTARAATIQAARDLYGAGSSAERAVIGAWTAVGVL